MRAIALWFGLVPILALQTGCRNGGDTAGANGDFPVLVLSPASADAPGAARDAMQRVESPPAHAGRRNEPGHVHANLAQAANSIASEMLATPALAEEGKIHRILVGAESLPAASAPEEERRNQAKRLRVELNRALNGRILFLSPFLAGLEKQRSAKAVDCRLEISLSEIESTERAEDTGLCRREIHLRVVALESKQTIWSGTYVFEDRI